MPDDPVAIGPLVLLTVGLGLVVFAVVTTTAFVKISVVLFIVRNALGLPQTPPNLVLYGMALALTAFVAGPVIEEVRAVVETAPPDLADLDAVLDTTAAAAEPVRGFLMRFTPEESRDFFVVAAERVWPEGQAPDIEGTDLSVLIPAFLAGELQRAFEVGFLLYLPFVVIDLVVTTVLIAMGMAMVTPSIIATPLKLLLFVTIDGWDKLVEGLVLGYAT